MRATERKGNLRDFFRSESEKLLEEEITGVLLEMANEGPTSDEYPGLLAKLEKLHTLKVEGRRKRVSFDTIVSTLGYFAGVAFIVVVEQKGHVLTSKAFSHLPKMK